MIKLITCTVGVGRDVTTYAINVDKIAYISPFPKNDPDAQCKIAFSEATRDYLIVQDSYASVIDRLTEPTNMVNEPQS